MRVEFLRFLAHADARPLAKRDKEMAFIVENKPRAEMQRAVLLWRLAEDHFHIAQLRRHAFGEMAARHRRAIRAALPLFGIGKIDEPVFFEVRVKCHIKKPALIARIDLRHTRYGLLHLALRRDNAKSPRSLGNEEVSVRQK